MTRQPRGAIVSVRLSASEQARLREIADSRGTSVSDLIRSYLRRELEPTGRVETFSHVPSSSTNPGSHVSWLVSGSNATAEGATLTLRTR